MGIPRRTGWPVLISQILIAACGGGDGPTSPTAANVTWRFCGASNIPLWLAVQNGNGPWTYVAPGANNTWSFHVNEKGGVAYVTSLTPSMGPTFAAGYALSVVYGTMAELQQRGDVGCSGPTALGSKTVRADVALTFPDFPFSDVETDVSMGGSTEHSQGDGISFVLSNVPDGAVDLVAALSARRVDSLFELTRKVIVRRGIDAPGNALLDTLDFDGPEGLTPDRRTLTIENLGGDTHTLSTALQTATTTGTLGTHQTVYGGQTAVSFAAVPADVLLPSDVHILTLSAIGVGPIRTATTVFKSPADQTVTLGPPLAASALDVAATTPYVRLRSQIPRQPEYNQLWSLRSTQGQPASTARWVEITMSAGYLGSADFDVTVPDFSGVANWSNSWGMVTGTQAVWSLTASGWNGSGATTPPIQVGTRVISAQRAEVFTP